MTIRNALWLMVLLVVPVIRVHAAEPPDARGIEFFESKVRPILVDHCLACHGPDKQKAGLRLDAADSMRTGGDSGPVIEPGNPEDSLLVETIGYESVTRMPPRGKLAPEQVEALTEWVRIGAPMPEASSSAPEPAKPAIDLESARSFWSFQPVQDPSPPSVSDSSWTRSPLDRFVLARLESEGLSPAPQADRHALIRRVSFDLTGLPPTPEEVEAFVSDQAPDAYERLIERLLSSPAYGERWARHWLDIARYGEDQAHSFQPRLYPNGYRYRDWVVSAFNSDMPYDRFLTEQIAADLLDEPDRLENLPALGFFACGPVYYGDKQQYDQIDDRIDTLCRGVLGLTVACARCHDHKYDPIPTSDYYALAGVFASSEYEEAPLVPPQVVKAYERSQKAIADQEASVRDDMENTALRLANQRAREISRYLLASWTWKNRRASDPKASIDQVARERSLDSNRLKHWIQYLDGPAEKRPALADWTRFQAENPPSDRLNDDLLLGPMAAELAQAVELFAIDLLGRLDAPLTYQDKTKGKPKKERKFSDADKALLADLVGETGLLLSTGPKIDVEIQLPESDRARLASAREELKRIKASAPSMYPVAHALKEGKPRDLKVLARGNPETTGEDAPRRFLSILGGDSLQT
ncbi:MAG TPA: DUF1549 domain-containing protein, partial [Isosphaeraceae bacterium]|nr:DUF1549 domain-containing protein [Isosphaeraceae bacterium]